MRSLNKTRILAFDIGGINIKATILDKDGNFLEEFRKTPTPSLPLPKYVIQTVIKLADDLFMKLHSDDDY